MSPTAIPAALRDFAAAARHSPDPSASVAALAELLAYLFDQAMVEVGEAPAPPPGPFDHSEFDFPPLEPIVATMAGHDFTEAELAEVAREAAGLAPEVWAALPAEEQALHRELALSKLRQEHAVEPTDHHPV